MSNDSNEPGNDTAAQAFQAGDRVRCMENPVDESGVVLEPDGPGYVLVEMAADSLAPGAHIHYRPNQLTLISRATPASAPAQTVDPGEQYDGEYVTEPQTRERMRVPQVCRDCAWDGLADYTVQGDFLPINGWRICKRCNAINGPYPLARMCVVCMGTGRVEGSLCASCRGTGIDPQHPYAERTASAHRLMTDQEAANAAVPHAEPNVDDMPYPDGYWAGNDDDSDPDGDEDWDDAGPDSAVPDDDDDDPDDADVDYDDWQRTPPEPATPAPAATVDPIPAMEAAMPAALGEAWAEWREACYRENVPPAVALITLVHHAARRGANVAVDLLATGTPPQEGATR